MATLLVRKSKKTGTMLYTVQFVMGRRRPCVPLGNVTKAQAQQVKGYIESLSACRRRSRKRFPANHFLPKDHLGDWHP